MGLSMTESLVAPCASDAQRRLEKLDPSDEKYRPLLRVFLSCRDLKSHVLGLQGPDLQVFIELLDEVSQAGNNTHQR